MPNLRPHTHATCSGDAAQLPAAGGRARSACRPAARFKTAASPEPVRARGEGRGGWVKGGCTAPPAHGLSGTNSHNKRKRKRCGRKARAQGPALSATHGSTGRSFGGGEEAGDRRRQKDRRRQAGGHVHRPPGGVKTRRRPGGGQPPTGGQTIKQRRSTKRSKRRRGDGSWLPPWVRLVALLVDIEDRHECALGHLFG